MSNIKTNKKPSYEELESYAKNLVKQINSLYKECEKMALSNTFKRLDYLMEIVKNESSFKASFIDKCKIEIERIMDVEPEITTESKDKEDGK